MISEAKQIYLSIWVAFINGILFDLSISKARIFAKSSSVLSVQKHWFKKCQKLFDIPDFIVKQSFSSLKGSDFPMPVLKAILNRIPS